MNATPIQPGSSDRDELARLLPEPAERDLPSGRHQRLQEFVMSQIHQDLRPAERAPRRSRRPVLLAGALVAAAAVAAVAVVIGTGGPGRSGGDSIAPAVPTLSGRQVLLAAATTAERKPAGSGTYWYVKTVSADGDDGRPLQWESWTRHDGQTWFRGEKSGGKVVKEALTIPFRLGGPDVSFERLQKLPTRPAALKTWIADSVKHSDVRTSAGRPDAAEQKNMVFDGLVSLVSLLPAPPKVRAAAFRAIASYPNVENLGPVKGGQGLRFSSSPVRPSAPAPSPSTEDQAEWARDQALKAKAERGQDDDARLVIDLATSQIRETNFFVTADGAEYRAPGGATLVTGWTNVLPK
ncbi:CU044_5270 family protein [Actinoallomurus bryophytorum]|uniref:CU044_5270 family protein n=1 Tax=Actinoallomurus bryophytorum TaxID=1490222 RepID=A0A543CKK2_9ACTN|nr:CU044_5270 family protein [Actinoallomurus bryophytorum]TQL97605.1 hypothetical protein FB559_3200 [Actinoallomurus bryophytorum]